MRNLKKILALVLALVMSLSLVTMANADFSDAAAIEHKEAVEVMAAAGVLQGSDGKFDPAGTLTRAQAAKIIAYVLTGGEPAAVTGAPFSDVPASHWAAAPIAYVAGKGIVDGLGDGSFNPNGQLTGYAFGKMLLNALKIEGTYTGMGWEIAVADALEDEELLDNLDDVVLGNALSREHAAQLALNAMKYTGGEKFYAVVVDEETIKFDNMNDALLYTAILDGAVYAGEQTETEGSLLDEVFEIECGPWADAYGRPATAYAHEDWAEDMIYAESAAYTFVIDEDTTVEDLIADKKLEKKITSGADDTALYVGQVVELFVDEKALTDVVIYWYEIYNIDSVEEVDEDADEEAIEDGAKYVVEIDGDDYYDIQLDGFDAKTWVEDAKVMFTMSDGFVYKWHDFEELGDAYDFIVIDMTIATGKEGKVTAKATDYIRVDGDKKVASEECVVDTESAIAVGTSYVFYTDPNGFVIYVTDVDDTVTYTLDDVLYVVDGYTIDGAKDEYGEEADDTHYIRVINLKDGKVESLVVAADEDATAGDLVTKKYDKDDKVYELTDWSDDDYDTATLTDVDLAADDTKVTADDSTKLRLTATTSYILIDAGEKKADLKVETKVGGISKDEVTALVVYKEGTNNIAAYVIVTAAEAAVEEFDNVVYVAADALDDAEEVLVVKGEDETAALKVAAYGEDGKVVDLYLAASTVSVEAGFYTYTVDEDGIYALSDKKTGYDAEDEIGFIYDEEYVSSYEGAITTDPTAEDLTADKAVVIDLTEDGKIDSIADLDKAIDDEKTVTLSIYANEGAKLIVVTEVA